MTIFIVIILKKDSIISLISLRVYFNYYEKNLKLAKHKSSRQAESINLAFLKKKGKKELCLLLTST